ncbi:hypothetical protein CWATWH0402_1079 [Crocosphaera watsonii WH 0402]|uniref:Uncharacterized protein n=3 Tax=Crocosphaera watsonii TaxID=263511 RepID=T2JYS9_CROWT|nr:hypothetical protein CWATWH0003_1280 [Crocosphaera watsonii WH 0003]CCQ55657.1 hypothetical protein CWATWH0005_5039 [Crocosphaera watsonii WH 0005]CCQ69787.1 hypothetical protein CWATWH0402_1079 [Crocosphaera watsonii WH 0402]
MWGSAITPEALICAIRALIASSFTMSNKLMQIICCNNLH